ncbi:MAG: hypothetical protein U0R80_03965 [Nocardioidaceae bacterium]
MGHPDEAAPAAELLEVGRSARSRRWPRPSPRVVAAVAVVALLLGMGAVAADRHLRAGEQQAVDRCASAARAAADDAWSRVSAMVTYVRPVLDSGGSAELRSSMYALVSSSATGSAASLDDARARCHAVRVLPLHTRLGARRDACLRGLADTTAFLDRLALDGRVVAERWPRQLSGC